MTPGRGKLRNHRRSRQYALVAGALIVVAALVAGGLYLANPGRSNRPSGQSSANAPPHETTVPNDDNQQDCIDDDDFDCSGRHQTSVSVSLPVVTCPTSFATPPSNPPSIPKFMQVTVPNDLANQLYVYIDQDSIMALVAPSGWVCQADYKTDGSGGVSVYPAARPSLPHLCRRVQPPRPLWHRRPVVAPAARCCRPVLCSNAQRPCIRHFPSPARHQSFSRIRRPPSAPRR